MGRGSVGGMGGEDRGGRLVIFWQEGNEMFVVCGGVGVK